MTRPRAIVLWDIDGTLMRSPGIGVRAFGTAVQRATGAVWTPKRLDVGGRTDPDIAARILEDAGIDDPSLVPAVLDALAAVYVELDGELRVAAIVLPGVAAALEQLAAVGVFQTVVTGNLRAVAAAKISAADLGAHLRLECGGYGSDHHERAALVRLAIDRVRAVTADEHRDAIWVIGDTPRDLAAARANDVRCALVATGTHGYDDLAALGADVVIADLTEGPILFDAITASL